MNSTPTFARMDNYPQFSSPDGATHSVAYAVVETTDAEASLALESVLDARSSRGRSRETPRAAQ